MKKAGYFWVGYADLMTSLFFVMLVLYIISFAFWQKTNNDLKKATKDAENAAKTMEILAEKGKIIESVESNLEALKKDSTLFIYEPLYNRYKLSFSVNFRYNKVRINHTDIKNFSEAEGRLNSVAKQLKIIVDELKKQKETDANYKNISYLIIVSGSASDMPGDDEDKNYVVSYKRAYNLYKYWKNKLNIDFDAKEYHDLLEFQIAGNGIGGVGRFPRDPKNNFISEKKNQRFLINVIPKIGEF